MREIHEFSMGFWPYEFAMGSPWRTHGLSMVNPWRHNSMESPWKTHGKFIWPKPHGKLMDCTDEFLLNTERPDKFHGKCVGSSTDIPWNIDGTYHAFSMECLRSLPLVFHGISI